MKEKKPNARLVQCKYCGKRQRIALGLKTFKCLNCEKENKLK